jgi:hypothetical protein
VDVDKQNSVAEKANPAMRLIRRKNETILMARTYHQILSLYNW